MARQRSTVIDFISNGKLSGSTTAIEFEGFDIRGDEGNGLRFFKTGATSTPSQTPIQRGDNSFTDSEGSVYDVALGSVISFDSNQWFPSPFGDDGAGVYVLSSSGWERAATQTITQVGNIDWDFSAPFNEGVEIERGYGSLDANGNRAVDFSRASGTGNINKSGVVEELLTDEPAITKDGLSIYGSYTNEMKYSETSISGWVASGVTVADVVINGISSIQITEDSSSGSHSSYYNQGVSVVAGEKVTLQYYVMKGADRSVRLRVGTPDEGLLASAFYDINNAQILFVSAGSARIVDYGDFVMISATASIGVSSNISLTGINLADGTKLSYLGDGSSSVTATARQLARTAYATPYIKTEGATATRAEDLATIPMMNNMPAPGKPFTIVFNADIPDTLDDPVNFTHRHAAFSINGTAFTLWRHVEGGSLSIHGTTAAIPYEYTIGLNRYVVTFNGTDIKLASNGVVRDSAPYSPVYEMEDPFRIGQAATSGTNLAKLNSEIKNFRIIHRALSDAEIAALGGAQ